MENIKIATVGLLLSSIYISQSFWYILWLLELDGWTLIIFQLNQYARKTNQCEKNDFIDLSRRYCILTIHIAKKRFLYGCFFLFMVTVLRSFSQVFPPSHGFQTQWAYFVQSDWQWNAQNEKNIEFSLFNSLINMKNSTNEPAFYFQLSNQLRIKTCGWVFH